MTLGRLSASRPLRGMGIGSGVLRLALAVDVLPSAQGMQQI